MKCLHCSVTIHDSLRRYPLFTSSGNGSETNIGWAVLGMECLSCLRPILYLQQGKPEYSSPPYGGEFESVVELSHVDIETEKGWQELMWPRHSNPRTVAQEVPAAIASDYREADKLLSVSPRASAALARRCLERVLHEAGGANSNELTKAIDQVVSSKNLPTLLGQELKATKEIGNFAAHPRKDTDTSQILDVEPGEAEWMLDVLENVFDFFYVKPAETDRMIASLNEKLIKAGKKPITG